MRVDLDARVRTRDGEDAGSVKAVVFDPEANEVRDVVVSTGAFLGRDILVPRQEIERATPDGEALRLGLTKEELEQLPDYVPERYGPPATGWFPPAGYGFSPIGVVWPIGFPATNAYVPSARGVPERPVWPEPQPDVEVSKGAVVLDRDAEDVGVVEDVLFDEQSGQLRGFVLRVGGTLETIFGGGDTTQVGREQVERVGDGVVYLRIDKDELERLTD